MRSSRPQDRPTGGRRLPGQLADGLCHAVQLQLSQHDDDRTATSSYRPMRPLPCIRCLQHRPESRNRFSTSTMRSFNKLERPWCIRMDARRSKGYAMLFRARLPDFHADGRLPRLAASQDLGPKAFRSMMIRKQKGPRDDMTFAIKAHCWPDVGPLSRHSVLAIFGTPRRKLGNIRRARRPPNPLNEDRSTHR